jgi:hypothetical protein
MTNFTMSTQNYIRRVFFLDSSCRPAFQLGLRKVILKEFISSRINDVCEIQVLKKGVNKLNRIKFLKIFNFFSNADIV